jgi:sugar (pentulose or hexulose) kinase
MTQDQQKPLRGIAVVDLGYTNSKVILYDHALNNLGERKMASPHRPGPHYGEIDVDPVIAFASEALRELDRILPIDAIVTSAHGACIVALDEQGRPAVPVMDYMSEPPRHIADAYHRLMPGYDECYTPPLPRALLHGMQLFWQQKVLPDAFARTKTILPLMQYVGYCLGGRAVTEVSSMSCQSHLVDMRNGAPSTLARSQGWAQHFAPEAKAWDIIGTLAPGLRGEGFRGRGNILAGVHDSNANFLRYIAGGQSHFTLLSTGTWIIGFDTDADITTLDPTRDIVANKSVFGKTVACCRFFGGKELELVGKGASVALAHVSTVATLINARVMALPSFTDSGGPLPGTGGKGLVTGPFVDTPENRAALAALYCALMVSQSLDALSSQGDVIVDGPFAQHATFLSTLAALRPQQNILASLTLDGTATGAACLALMVDGKAPHISIDLQKANPAALPGLGLYQQQWLAAARALGT